MIFLILHLKKNDLKSSELLSLYSYCIFKIVVFQTFYIVSVIGATAET